MFRFDDRNEVDGFTRARWWLMALTLLVAFLGLILLEGCGAWIQYPDDYETPDTPALDDFPDVDHLAHLTFDGLLAEHLRVSEDGLYVLIDYDGWAASGESIYLLDSYLAALNTVDPADLADSSERIAYWLNGYNASVIHGVLLDYGGDAEYSVLDSGVFFDDPIHAFAGHLLTLNQIEHGVLRGDMANPAVTSADEDTQAAIEGFHADVWDDGELDARIHVALNCASLGCPNLRSTAPFAYKPATLEEQLYETSAAFCDNTQKGAGPDGISRIFDWYGSDFDAEYGGVAGFIEDYRDGGLGGVDTDTWLPYDWSLNIAEPE